MALWKLFCSSKSLVGALSGVGKTTIARELARVPSAVQVRWTPYEENGYATAHRQVHLGYKPEFSPRAHGFDVFFIAFNAPHSPFSTARESPRPAGTVCAQVGITMDLTLSILAATATPVPSPARREGLNLFPILQRRAPDAERTYSAEPQARVLST